jgi:PASTA domain
VALKFLNNDKKITIDDSAAAKELSLATEVPQLKSLTMREVLSRAADQKIEVKFVGAGRVESTMPEAGEILPTDRHMTIFLK